MAMWAANLSMRPSSTKFCLSPADLTMSRRRSGCLAQNSSMSPLTLRLAARRPGTLATESAGFRIPPTAASLSRSLIAFLVSVALIALMCGIKLTTWVVFSSPVPGRRWMALPHRPVLTHAAAGDAGGDLDLDAADASTPADEDASEIREGVELDV